MCRRALELKLCSYAKEVVAEFQRQTGLKVHGVNVSLADVRTIGLDDQSIVTGVDIEVRL
jgi:uncharacterized alkaline shock family protein YloU